MVAYIELDELFPYGFHGEDSLRAARIAWNALLQISKTETESVACRKYCELILREMNKNGLFEKQGAVQYGPIAGDL